MKTKHCYETHTKCLGSECSQVSKLQQSIDAISRDMKGPMPDGDRIALYYDRKELRQKLEHLKGEEVSI